MRLTESMEFLFLLILITVGVKWSISAISGVEDIVGFLYMFADFALYSVWIITGYRFVKWLIEYFLLRNFREAHRVLIVFLYSAIFSSAASIVVPIVKFTIGKYLI